MYSREKQRKGISRCARVLSPEEDAGFRPTPLAPLNLLFTYFTLLALNLTYIYCTISDAEGWSSSQRKEGGWRPLSVADGV